MPKFDLEKWQTFWKLHGLPDSLKVLPTLSKRAMVRRLHTAERLLPDDLLQAALNSCGASDVLGRFRRFRKQFSLETRMFSMWTEVQEGEPQLVFDPTKLRSGVKHASVKQFGVREDAAYFFLGSFPKNWRQCPTLVLRLGETYQAMESLGMPIWACAVKGSAKVEIWGQEVVWSARKKMVTIQLNGVEA